MGQQISLVKMYDSLTNDDILDLDYPKPSGNQKISDFWKKAILF